MFFVFGKCLFLLRWNDVLSGSHALHLRFNRNKSVTRTVYPLIGCLLSGTHPYNVRFSNYMSGACTVIASPPGSTCRLQEL